MFATRQARMERFQAIDRELELQADRLRGFLQQEEDREEELANRRQLFGNKLETTEQTRATMGR